MDGSSCLVSSSLSSVLREESPLCHAYVCVVSPHHLCVCMGMCMVWQRCAVGSALSVPLSPILGQSTSACWLCLLAVPDVVCACLLAHHACLWLPRVGCLWSVLCVLCMRWCSHLPSTRHTTLSTQSTLHHLCPRGVSSHSRSHHASSPSACGPLEYGACVSLVHAEGGGGFIPSPPSVCPLLVGGRLTTLPPPSSTHSSITSCCDACVCPLVEGCWFGLARTTILSPHTRVAVAVTVAGWLCVCFTAHTSTHLHPPPHTSLHACTLRNPFDLDAGSICTLILTHACFKQVCGVSRPSCFGPLCGKLIKTSATPSVMAQ